MLKKTIRAFALLEVAIALSILGLIAYMGMPLINRLQSWQHTHATTDHQEQIMQALSAYVLANSRLPCAAENASGQAKDGINIGFVPYQTLGIPENIAKDGQHHWMTYAVEPNLTSSAVVFLQDPGLSLDSQTIFCKATSSETLTIRQADEKSCIMSPDFAAVVIVSHGNSGGYYLDNGEISPSNSSDMHKKSNLGRNGNFVTKKIRRSTTDIFDDIVTFASRNNLMAIWGKCPCKIPD